MAGMLHDGHMAEDGARVQQALVLVQDGLHVQLCAEQALHQQVGLAEADHGHGLGGGFGIRGGVDHAVPLLGQAEILEHLPHHGLVTHQDGLHQARLHRCVHRLQGVGVVGPGHHQALAGPVLHRKEELVEGVDPHGWNLSKEAGVPAGSRGR